MTAIPHEQIHSYLTEILDSIDEYCTREGIRYSMAYGTLIGAVRHKGFIPWDDDIDLLMPRPDFKRFIAGFGREQGARYQCLYQCPEFMHFFAKVCDRRTVIKQDVYRFGLFVDIFPVDGKSDDPSEQIENERTLTRYAHRLTLLSSRFNPFNLHQPLFPAIEAHFRGAPYFISGMNGIIGRYPYETASLAGTVSMTRNGTREVFPKTLFESYTTLSFEGRQFQAFKDWKIFLTQQYGDYMTLPPVKDRKSHNIKAFLLDD